MDIALFEKEMEKKIKYLFKADDYYFELVDVDIPENLEHDLRIELSQDSYYYLASTKLDIPVTVALYLSSERNYLSTSKTDWEFDNALRLEAFRNYLHVRTENALSPFRFKLKFMKVTPYKF